MMHTHQVNLCLIHITIGSLYFNAKIKAYDFTVTISMKILEILQFKMLFVLSLQLFKLYFEKGGGGGGGGGCFGGGGGGGYNTHEQARPDR